MGYTCWSHVSIYMFTCVYTGATMLSKEWLRDGQSVSISRLDLWTDKHIHLIYTCIYVHVSIYTYICRCKYSMKQMATWLFNHSLSLSHTHVPYTYTRSLSPSHMCSLSLYIYVHMQAQKFYEKNGYATDETCPSLLDSTCCFRIMGRDVCEWGGERARVDSHSCAHALFL